MTRVITVIEKETRYRARGRVCGQGEAEASFKRRRSAHACLLPPGTFIGFYGGDFGPDAWFVGLYPRRSREAASGETRRGGIRHLRIDCGNLHCSLRWRFCHVGTITAIRRQMRGA